MADNFGCEDPSCKETRNRRCVQPGELTGVSLDGDDGLSPADHRDGDAVAGTRKGVRLEGGTEREKTPQRRQGADGGSEEGGRTTTVEKESGMRQCTGDTSVASRIDGDNSAGSLPRMALAPHLEEEQQSASVGVRKSNNAGETISEDDSGNKSTSGRRRRSISSNITTPVRLARACSQYYRTKMCLYVLHGRPCSRGHKCVYAHSEEELRVPPDLSRTRLCPSLKQQGTCPKEESCPYAHSTVELRHTVTVFKTKICHMWNKGKCGAGAACRHAHGVDELKHYRQLSHRELVALSRGPSGVQRDGESGIGGGASSTSRPTSPHPTEACQRSSEGSPVSGGPRSADPEKKSRIPEETEASEEPPAKSSATVDTAKEDRLDLSADTPSRTERLQVEERADEGGSIKAHPSRRKRREPRKNFGEVKKAWKEAVQQGPTKEQTDDRAASPCQASSSGRPRPGSEGHVSEGGSRSPVTSVRSQVPAPGAPRSCPLTGRWTNEIGTPSSRVAWGIYEASEEIPDLIGNPGCRASRGSARPSAGCGVARPVEATNPFRPCGDATGVLLDNVAGRTEIFSSTGKPRSAACCAPRTSKTTLSPPPRPAGQYATDIDGLTVAGKAAYATASEVFRCLVDVGGTVSKDNQRERPDERKVRPSTLQKAHGTSSGMGSSRNQRLLQANASSFLGGRPVASRPWPPSVYPAGSSPSGAGSLSEAGDFLAVAQLLALLQNPDSNCASKESRGGFQDARVPAFHPHNAAPAAWETQSHQPSPEPDTAFPSQSTSPGCSAVAGHESGNQNVYTTHRTHRVVPASMGAARVPPSPSAAAVPGSGPDSKGDVAAAAAWELLLSQRCRTELPRDLKQGCEGAQGGRSSRGVRTDAHSFIPGVKIPPIAETRPLVSMSRGWGSMTEKRQPRKDVRPASRLDLYAPSGMGLADDFSSSALQHILSLFRSSKASGQGESVPPCSKSVGAAIGFSQGMPDSCAMPAESNDYDAPGSRTTAAWETCIPAPVAGKSEVLRSGAARAEPFIGGSCSSDLGEWQPSTQLIGVDSGLASGSAHACTAASSPFTPAACDRIGVDSGLASGSAHACTTASSPFTPAACDRHMRDLLGVFSPSEDTRRISARRDPLSAPPDYAYKAVEELFRQLSLRPGSCTPSQPVAPSDPWDLGRHRMNQVDATRLRSSSETLARGEGFRSQLSEECNRTDGAGAADALTGTRDLSCPGLETSGRSPPSAIKVNDSVQDASPEMSAAWLTPSRRGDGFRPWESGRICPSRCAKEGDSLGLSGPWGPRLTSHYPALSHPDNQRGQESLPYSQPPVQREEGPPMPMPARFADSAVTASWESHIAAGCSSGVSMGYGSSVHSGNEFLRSGSFEDRESA